MKIPHVMSKYATEVDCLRAREAWYQEQLAAYESLFARYHRALEAADDCIKLYSHPGSKLIGEALDIETPREHFNEVVAKELEKIAATYGEGFDPAVEADLNARAVEWRSK